MEGLLEILSVLNNETRRGKATGMGLAKDLITMRPNIPIILCTGYTEMISRDEARALGIREFVMKPLVKREMAETIRRVLDTKTQS